ncbi:hypothetical protein ACNJYA_02690 [Bradyrhizobium sp. DASA03068]|uniref:hypothetical protein n=1 Tax=Bradyrhizobium sp. BLXBL-01 TaxID=3395915 RepID=UPI003F6E84DB
MTKIKLNSLRERLLTFAAKERVRLGTLVKHLLRLFHDLSCAVECKAILLA